MYRAVLAAVFLSACAGAPAARPAPEAQPELPFVKLAKRNLLLVVHWIGPSFEPGDQDRVEDGLAAALSRTYGTTAEAYRRQGAFKGFDGALYVTMVKGRVDDVVVLEVERAPSGGLRGAAQVVVVNQERSLGRWPVEVSSSANRFVQQAWLAVRTRWVDPGASAPFSLVRAADGLAKSGRCDLAVPIYAKTLASRRSLPMSEMKRLAASFDLQRSCQRALKLESAREKDANARFEVKLDVSALSGRRGAALKGAFQSSSMRTLLSSMTAKPVQITVTPQDVVIRLRYDPGWYHDHVADKPRYVRGGRAIYLEPWVPLMQEVLELCARAGESLGPLDARLIGQLRLALRLERFSGDALELEFADRNGKLVVASEVRVKVDGAAEAIVPSADPRAMRQFVFILGAAESLGGKLTEAGLLYRFLGLTP